MKMKLSEFIKRIKIETKLDDPEFVFIHPYSAGTIMGEGGETITINKRSDYFDETLYGAKIRRGKYFVIEVGE
jgi:hypothetical protein